MYHTRRVKKTLPMKLPWCYAQMSSNKAPVFTYARGGGGGQIIVFRSRHPSSGRTDHRDRPNLRHGPGLADDISHRSKLENGQVWDATTFGARLSAQPRATASRKIRIPKTRPQLRKTVNRQTSRRNEYHARRSKKSLQTKMPWRYERAYIAPHWPKIIKRH